MADSGARRLRFIVVGCGGRGSGFARWVLEHPEVGSVVAVADPVEDRRRAIADKHGIPDDMQFNSWEDVFTREKFADVVLNGTMENIHRVTAVAAMERGYDMLLEKPMAETLEDCVEIDRVRRETGRIVSVCHSLRYHLMFAELKRLVDSGAIGRLLSIDQLEAVEPTHYTHAFVRGKWGNEGRSTCMLLAKCCHDIDVMGYLVGQSCKRVSSFGSLIWYRPENAPEGAAKRCVENCSIEPTCPYSAYKLYAPAESMWWTFAHMPKDDRERLDALKTSPWGRCVWHCDNDVDDHQVVNFEYGDGVTGTLTMAAAGFGVAGSRYVRLHGSEGSVRGEMVGNKIELCRYRDRAIQRIDIPEMSGSHGGGDSLVLHNLVQAVRTRDESFVLTGTAESLATHRVTFAAEQARRECRVVELSELGG